MGRARSYVDAIAQTFGVPRGNFLDWPAIKPDLCLRVQRPTLILFRLTLVALMVDRLKVA